MSNLTAQQLYAQLYDLRVTDWPGELDFYRQFLRSHVESQQGILEIACGTGRVTLPLAKNGCVVTGVDISPELLDIARSKTKHQANPTWVLADMRTFELGRKFGVVISPGHSFQFMNPPEEQIQCLEHVKHHLVPGGWLILHLDHQDVRWLAELVNTKTPEYAIGNILVHPVTRKSYRYSHYWTYEPSTQTATVHRKWEELNSEGKVIEIFEHNPDPMHCVFRSEMDHLLRSCGFTVEALYGDFNLHALQDSSHDMIWVARAE